MQYVPVQCFIRALFASRLPPGVAYLFAGPLLVVEQLKRQLAIIHEAQRARGVPLSHSGSQPPCTSHSPAPSENISQTTYFARRRVAFSAIRQKKVAAL